MNLKCCVLITAVTASLAALPVKAQDAPNDSRSADRDAARELHKLPRLGRFEKANKVIGAEVRNLQDEKLGKVKDLAVDVENGLIVEVIVATGGHLGVGEEFVAVPPGSFTVDEPGKTLHLDVTLDKLKAAPRLEFSKWDVGTDDARVLATYQYFGAERGASKAVPAEHPATAERASKLLGLPVRNLQDEKLGKLDNLLVDLPAGRIAEVLIESGGFLGIGGEYSVVPPGALHFDTDHKSVRLDTTKESLLRAPHFPSTEWPDVNQPGYVIGVYQFYHVPPYFGTNDVDNTRQNVRDRTGQTLTPLDQGNSPADLDITSQIRKQILAVDGLSLNARNIKVITREGRVTLRGTVNSDEEKTRLGKIAAEVASPETVDNQLEVK